MRANWIFAVEASLLAVFSAGAIITAILNFLNLVLLMKLTLVLPLANRLAVLSFAEQSAVIVLDSALSLAIFLQVGVAK